MSKELHPKKKTLSIEKTDDSSGSDSGYFSFVGLFFLILSGLALHYQQYLTSAILYTFVMIFDTLGSFISTIFNGSKFKLPFREEPISMAM